MANHFEARKWSYRQTKEGVVVSFLVHPEEVRPEIATSPLGTRYMVGFAQIGDDEQPVERATSEPITITREKDRKRFSELEAPQQSGILCADARFQQWLVANYSREWAAACGTEPDPDGNGGWSDIAAATVRKICGVHSRGEMTKANPHALREWGKLLERYEQYKTDAMAEGLTR